MNDEQTASINHKNHPLKVPDRKPAGPNTTFVQTSLAPRHFIAVMLEVAARVFQVLRRDCPQQSEGPPSPALPYRSNVIGFAYKKSDNTDGIVVAVHPESSGDYDGIKVVCGRFILAGALAYCTPFLERLEEHINSIPATLNRSAIVDDMFQFIANSKETANKEFNNELEYFSSGSLIAGFDDQTPVIMPYDDGERHNLSNGATGDGRLAAEALFQRWAKDVMTEEEAMKLGRQIIHFVMKQKGPSEECYCVHVNPSDVGTVEKSTRDKLRKEFGKTPQPSPQTSPSKPPLMRTSPSSYVPQSRGRKVSNSPSKAPSDGDQKSSSDNQQASSSSSGNTSGSTKESSGSSSGNNQQSSGNSQQSSSSSSGNNQQSSSSSSGNNQQSSGSSQQSSSSSSGSNQQSSSSSSGNNQQSSSSSSGSNQQSQPPSDNDQQPSSSSAKPETAEETPPKEVSESANGENDPFHALPSENGYLPQQNNALEVIEEQPEGEEEVVADELEPAGDVEMQEDDVVEAPQAAVQVIHADEDMDDETPLLPHDNASSDMSDDVFD
uniref:Proteasome endopeptidase complex n=1 Tax=Panagrellus redivivus TaxID=6233 RepID=A0A7E4VND1_PANRE